MNLYGSAKNLPLKKLLVTFAYFTADSTGLAIFFLELVVRLLFGP